MKENKFLNNHFSLLKIVVLVFQIYTTVRMYLSKAEFNFKQLTLYPANYTINMSTVYTFTFGRVNYNNGSETPWSTNAVPSTSNISVVFPSDYSLTGFQNCSSLSITSKTATYNIATFNCTIIANTIIFQNALTSITDLYIQTASAIITNVRNPYPAITTGQFIGYIGSDQAFPNGGASINLVAATFSQCTVSFGNGGYVNQTSPAIITLTPLNALNSSSSIVVKFPSSKVWTQDISSTLLPINAGTMSCTKLTNVNPGISCYGNFTAFTVTSSNMFSSSIHSQFSFQINNFLSPPTLQPIDLITITSYISTYKVDTCTISVSSLVANQFIILSINSIETMIVNQKVGITINMTFADTVDENDQFQIIFPNSLNVSYTNVTGSGSFGSSSLVGKTLSVTQNTAASITYYTQQFIVINFYTLTAPSNTRISDPITVNLMRNGYLKMTGAARIQALPSSILGTVSNTIKTVFASTSYIFNITLNDPLSSAGYIKIIFPNEIILPTTLNGIISGTSLNSNPTISINPLQNSVILTSINSSTNQISNQTLKVTLTSIINAKTTSPSSNFTIQSYYDGLSDSLVATGKIQGITASQGTLDSTKIKLTASSYIVSAGTVTYTINFVTTYQIPQHGFVIIQFPTDIKIDLVNAPNNCFQDFNSSGSLISSNCSINLLDKYSINFTTLAVSSHISAGTNISLSLKSVCTNPDTTRNVNGFSILTYSSTEYILQSANSGISIQMITPAQCFSVSVTRNSNQNSAVTNYTLSLAQKAFLNASSILIITFPIALQFSIDSYCTNLAGDANLSCIINNQSLTVSLTQQRTSLQIFGVIVTKIINPPSFQPLSASSPFIFLTKTPDNISSYCTFTLISSLTNSVASSFSNISSLFFPQIFLTNTQLTIKFIPSIRIIPSYLIVNIEPSITIGTLSFSSTGISSPTYTLISSNSVNISGNFMSSQMDLTISGLTSPSSNPTAFTKLSSYKLGGYKIDQSLTNIQFKAFCQLPCRTCVTSNKTNCLSCYTNTTISLQIYYLSALNFCFSACPSGYFQNSTLYFCQICSSICLTCENYSENCTSCNDTSLYPFLNKTLGVGTCLQSCPTYFYPDYTQSSNICVRCQSPCNDCVNKTFCLSCVTPYFYYLQQCITICPNSITIKNSIINTCDNCSSECATCSVNITNCVDCASNAALYNGTCVTTCPSPLVINNGACANCDLKCLTCSITYNNCTSCNTTSLYKYLLNNKCLSTCDYLYYPDIINGLCLLCSTLNIGCNNCSSTSTCYSCNTGYVFLNSKCYNQVPIGYVNISGIAVPCTGDCATCSIITSNCTACITKNLLDNQCITSCPNSTVAVNRICTSCIAPCYTCSNIQTNCTSCLTNWTSVVFLNNYACNSSCPDYTYKNYTNYQCTPCASPCLKCISQSQCITCLNNYFLLGFTCNLTCPSGYLGLNKTCQRCTYPCDTCSLTLTNCMTCVVNYYLYNSSSPSCISNCTTVGLYPNLVSQVCEGCSVPCSTCTNTSSTCSSCLTGYLYDNYCYSPCPQGTFISGAICSDCPIQCRTCNSSTICLTCQLNFYLFINFCVLSCPDTHPVITQNKSCVKCTNSACSNCSSNDYCFECMSPFYLFKGNCLATCPNGYSQDPTNSSNCIINKTQQTLSQSLSYGGNLFPIPFTIAALFIGIATIMSKFQNSQTFISGALYSLWGVLQWAALAIVLYLFYIEYGYQRVQFYILGGSFCLGYLFNLLALITQNCYLIGDAKMNKWKQYKIHQCWFYFVSIISLLTTHKFKNVLFCKLFNFHILKSHLQDIQKFRVFNVFSFISFIQSGGVIFGICLILFTYTQVVNQILMQYIDVLILTIANIILAILNSRKQPDFFQHKDEDGLIFNRRIEESDQILSGLIILPSTKQEGFDYRNTPLKSANSTSRRLDSLSQYQPYSVHNRSIQADPLLGMDSRITHLDDYSINSLNIFQHSDKGIQKDEIPLEVQDKSVDQTAKMQNQVSIQMDNISHNQVSIQFQNFQEEVSIQFGPNNMEKGVGMSREQVSMGMQANPNIQDYSIQYSAKPVFINIDEDYMSEEQSQNNTISKEEHVFVAQTVKVESKLQAQLQLDIDEKLRQRQEQLQKLQWQRKQQQKLQALNNFQLKKQKLKELKKEENLINKISQKDIENNIYNNENSRKNQTSLLSSNADLIVNMKNRLLSSNESNVKSRQVQSRLQTQSQNQKTQKQFIQLLSNQKQTEQNNNESNKLEQSNNEISLNMTAEMQNNHNKQKIIFESNDRELQSSQEYSHDDGIRQPRNLQQYNYGQVSKQTSTKFISTVKGRRPPLPKNSRQLELEDTSQDIQKTFNASLQDQIINNPIRPDAQHLRKNNRHHYPVQYKQENIDYQQRTNLTQFLSKKNRSLQSATLTRKNNQHLDEEQKYQNKQEPLPLPQYQRSQRQNLQFNQGEKMIIQPFNSEEIQINRNMPKGIKFRNKSKVKSRSQQKGNEKLRINEIGSNQFQKIPYNVDDNLAKQLEKQQKKAKNRKKSIQFMEELLQRPNQSGPKNYSKPSFAVEQKKKKSLQKVYLNRGHNKQK